MKYVNMKLKYWYEKKILLRRQCNARNWLKIDIIDERKQGRREVRRLS